MTPTTARRASPAALWVVRVACILLVLGGRGAAGPVPLRARVAAAPGPCAVLAAAAEAHRERAGGLDGRDVCAVFEALAALEGRFRGRDASGALVPGLNATVLLYHKPFAQQRAELVRSAAAAVPSLSGTRAVILLRHVCALAPAGFAGGPLCTGTCPLRREGLR